MTNQAGAGVAQEGAATHVGPYVVGSNSTVLLSGMVGDNGARAELEKAGSPAETEAVLDGRLPLNQHLGAPIDYGLYLVGRMADEVGNADFGVPDFNLDSDRGYAWHCWDWDRSDIPCVPDINPAFGEDYSYPLPVSYTHLDVYKRQPQDLPVPIRPLPAGAGGARVRHHRRRARRRPGPDRFRGRLDVALLSLIHI